jgi:hypothetical protein
LNGTYLVGFEEQVENAKCGKKRRKTRQRINREEFKQYFLRENADFHEEGVILV